ncbi:hypothetical protein GBW32_02715 [Streptomyces tsukubensis]|nr:hypothetical protein GBW32_02715 [Streptomyces tsukubensis]
MGPAPSLQRGPDSPAPGIVRLGRTTGDRTSPQGRRATLLPQPPPSPLHPHRPRDLRVRDAGLEQLDRPNTPRLAPTEAATKEEERNRP